MIGQTLDGPVDPVFAEVEFSGQSKSNSELKSRNIAWSLGHPFIVY